MKPTTRTRDHDGSTLEDDDWAGFDDSDINVHEESRPSHPLPKSKIQEPILKSNLKKPSKKPLTDDGSKGLSGTIGFGILNNDSDQGDDGKSPVSKIKATSAKVRTVSAWHPLGLSTQVLSSLARTHFPTPTAIQSLAIPEILGGHNVIGKASTGSGKTLAFGIPILEHYLEHGVHIDHKRGSSIEERKDPPTALIISPTRELAHQLSEHLNALCSNLASESPTIATITGGLSQQKQQRILVNSDIIVGTPGRLWEIISSTKGLMPWLKQIQYLVLDEADRLLSAGHFKELEEILDALNKPDANDDPSSPHTEQATSPFPKRQILIFSATFSPTLNHKLAGHQKVSSTSSDSLEHLLSRLTFHTTPKFIDASPTSNLPSTLTSYIVSCGALEKDLYLYALLLTHFPTARTLVFVNSVDAVRRLVPLLQNLDIEAYGLHGDKKPQKARMRSIERFSSSGKDGTAKGKGVVLVATDAAERGLDIPSVQAVVHYHLPREANKYVHRSGRTARKGNKGSSVLLCAPDEVQGMKRLVASVFARSNAKGQAAGRDKGLQPLEVDRHVVSRLSERVRLAKRIADAEAGRRKIAHEKNWLETAAEELGVEYDSEEFAATAGVKKGKGKEKKGDVGKGEVRAMKVELGRLLRRRVNVGVSERYLSAGGIDVEALLEGGGHEGFLGMVNGVA